MTRARHTALMEVRRVVCAFGNFCAGNPNNVLRCKRAVAPARLPVA